MLLGDFHIHTTWSDGRHSLPEVVDLFGRSGHDVIAITDQVVNSDSFLGKAAHRLRLSVTKEKWDVYRAEIEREARHEKVAPWPTAPFSPDVAAVPHHDRGGTARRAAGP